MYKQPNVCDKCMNDQMHVTSVQMIQTYVQLIQMTNPVSMQATRTHTMMKLPIKQYETHTTIKLHGEIIPSTILARSLQDLPSQGKFRKSHQCRTSQFNFYVGGTHPCSPTFP